MKLWQLPLDVTGDPPQTVSYKGRTRSVSRVIDRWHALGRWWHQEPPRDYYLLELTGGTVIEVYTAQYPEGQRWMLSRTFD